jgi:zinc D-Ala-D-Ala carboxypeptidase
MRRAAVLVIASAFFLPACTGRTAAATPAPSSPGPVPFAVPAAIPEKMLQNIEADRDAFIAELEAVLETDREGFLELVDKKHELTADHSPRDLVPLAWGRSYKPNRDGLSLRAGAEDALEKMAAAARKDGVVLLASSSYRSYDYQKTVYERNVRELGKEAADRESARPGTSQHQLGTAVDFGSITDEFAFTSAGKWLSLHAGEYGWSLSFPDGYETVTGYRWESWHYRYIGVGAAAFQKKWFADIQQYMMEFIDAWKRQRGVPTR